VIRKKAGIAQVAATIFFGLFASRRRHRPRNPHQHRDARHELRQAFLSFPSDPWEGSRRIKMLAPKRAG
jgi:hypothetical protein